VLDLTLAILHHLAVFALVATLAMEGVMLRATTIDVPRLAKLDARFGMTAMLVIVIGVTRVIWGGKGWAFYAENPFFWGKIACFVAIGLLSIGPTVMFLRWRKAAAADAGFAPPADQRQRARVLVGLQGVLLVPLLGFAAAMARWPF
jgi:putative membrane protein